MKVVVFLLFLLTSTVSYADTLMETIKKATGVKISTAPEQLFVDIVQERRNQLKRIIEERDARQIIDQDFRLHLQESVEEISNIIVLLEKDSSKEGSASQEFIGKQQVLYKELNQILKDLQRVDEDVMALFDELINILRSFVEDPEFKAFKQERHLQERLYYSFEDLHSLYDVIVSQERLVAQLAEQEKNMQSEQDSRRRMVKSADEEHFKRVEELKNLTERLASATKDTIIAEQQEKEMLSLEERLYRNKKELAELRLQQSRYTIDLIQVRLFIERAHLDLLRQHSRMVKSSIRVTEADVIHAQELLNSQKKEYFKRKEEYQNDRDALAVIQKECEQRRDAFSRKYGIALGRDLDEWGREPKQTISSYVTIAELGTLNSQVQWLQEERNFLDTQRALEDEKAKYLSLQASAKSTYYKISGRKFNAEEEIAQEIKHYEMQRSDAQSTLAIARERLSAVADILNQQKKRQHNIAIWKERVQKQKDQLFKDKSTEYEHMLELLNESQEYIKKQIDVLGKLTGTYSATISEINAAMRLMSFIIGELQSITIWYRPEYAVTWQGIRNITTDIYAFFGDIRAYIVRLDMPTLLTRIREIATVPLDVIAVLFNILLLYGVCWAVKIFVPRMKGYLRNCLNPNAGISNYLCYIVIALITFIDTHFIGLTTWTTLFLVFFYIVQDPYLYSIFCLCSIVYLIYIIYRFMQFLENFNAQHDYVLLAADFQRRFIFVFSALLYATVALTFFRQAFMRITYYRTELPTILMAVNFIVFQTALIFLISKEQILTAIPTRNDVWLWIRDMVDTYFYLIVLFAITIIVMSNPYVGFGRLVLYMMSSFLYTALLVKFLFWAYGWVKQAVSYIFFSTDDEPVRERFAHARTWFGLSIIGSFFIFMFVGIIATAKIWGWSISLRDMVALMNSPLLLETTPNPVTMFSLLQIIGFVMMGFIAAYALNRFVLDKIFDLLLVDPGVQYTTVRFIQYSVVVVFVFFGFKNVGLGDLIGYILGALALGIGWYVREPIGDFVAYFIILVQRPLKIGDFVQIDAETIGVVRKITPRAIVIRRKNSTTIVVPNSHIMSHSIVNWNYVRTFIAFNDILITVAYKEDPIAVRDLLLTAVASHQYVLRNPKPLVRLEEFGEYGYVFLVRGFISSAYTMDMWDIASDVRIAIVTLFKEHAIEIAELIRIVKDPQQRLQKMSPLQREDMANKIKE